MILFGGKKRVTCSSTRRTHQWRQKQKKISHSSSKSFDPPDHQSNLFLFAMKMKWKRITHSMNVCITSKASVKKTKLNSWDKAGEKGDRRVSRAIFNKVGQLGYAIEHFRTVEVGLGFDYWLVWKAAMQLNEEVGCLLPPTRFYGESTPQNFLPIPYPLPIYEPCSV